jgi:catechol 2,3-dioxygenase-like lactoylglutathione lyase family enzyme
VGARSAVCGPAADRLGTVPPRFLDHLAFDVADLEASRRFYRAALAPWGAHEVHAGAAYGYGPPGAEDVWIAAGVPGPPLHVALCAPDRATVDAFHRAALAAGGRDNGAPGLRPRYHPGYYAAYALDPDGNNVEAVHHGGGAQGWDGAQAGATGAG